MRDFWCNKRVLVTGAKGFIGQHVVATLRERGVRDDDLMCPTPFQCNLLSLEDCLRTVKDCQVVIHLAARTGGIQYSSGCPASQYRECTLIDGNILEAAHHGGVEKFVGVGTLLAYPEDAPQPLREEFLHNGRVAATHVGIGTAKRDLTLACEMYHQEYGLNAVTVLSANAYGPGDRFDPAVAHVIPATIVKCFRDGPLVVWGDGTPTRDFLYVADVAEGIVLAAEKLNAPQYVINLASGNEISIDELAHLIAQTCGFTGQIVFDKTRSGGDSRRCADGTRARELLGFTPNFDLVGGLKRTVEWYRSQR